MTSNNEFHWLFVIPQLRGGGAERVVQTLAEHICSRGDRLTILTLESPESGYPIHKDVRIKRSLSSSLCLGPGKLLLLPIQAVELGAWALVMRPQAVVTFMYRPNFVGVLCRCLGLIKHVIITEHVSTVAYLPDRSLKSRILLRLVKSLYPHADRVQAVSKGVADGLIDLGVPRHRVLTIPNPVDISKIAHLAKEEHSLTTWVSRRPTLVNIGRLCPQKDQATLLRALSIVRRQYDAQLLLIGTGPDEQELKALAVELCLTEVVLFAGWQDNPYSIASRCDLFVFASVFEGFGLALVEAMACGLPVVSTDCPEGPREILDGGRHGILVALGDDAGLADSIVRVLSSADYARELSLKARTRANDYDIASIGPRFLEMLDAATATGFHVPIE